MVRVEEREAPQDQRCPLKLAKADAEAMVTVCLSLLEGECQMQSYKNKRNKEKLKSSWGNIFMEAHCSMLGYVGATKQGLNKPGLYRACAWQSHTNTHCRIQKRVSTTAGLPQALKCSGLHRPWIPKGSPVECLVLFFNKRRKQTPRASMCTLLAFCKQNKTCLFIELYMQQQFIFNLTITFAN